MARNIFEATATESSHLITPEAVAHITMTGVVPPPAAAGCLRNRSWGSGRASS
ncbi:phosphoethanolamine transferase domain-containing protein [Haematobacter genomosp. 1]|uniref:Phosphoethanolamine transferase N-terminal domain-containing protein n=1 Tax=Haematobacter genomosp. 1 TaxID=366618 RepID=A0A212AAG2_9RHOB|nr:hypothetical protein CDV49_12120 [Haematobacter genomosp. 1]